MKEELYTMQQVSKMTGLSYDTLKYYCKEGLIPDVKRDKNNYRIFDNKNIGWIKSLSCLKKCGMSHKEIKEYMRLCMIGKSSIPQRNEILDKKLKDLEEQKSKIQESIDFINWKKQFYSDVMNNKTEYFSYLIRDEK